MKKQWVGEGGERMSVPPLLPVFRRFFQVPYDVTPLFATLTKTAGVCTLSSRNGTSESTEKLTGRKTRLDPRRAPSGPILRQTRIHSRRRLRSRRRLGQTPSQQRPHPRQNPPTTPSPPRPRPPHFPRLRLLPFTIILLAQSSIILSASELASTQMAANAFLV